MNSPSSLNQAHTEIGRRHRLSEAEAVQELLDYVHLSRLRRTELVDEARELVHSCRKRAREQPYADRFLQGYGLTTSEGVALLCLVEALLRVPDRETAEALVKEKLTEADWGRQRLRSGSWFVSLSGRALSLASRVMESEVIGRHGSALQSAVSKLGETVTRQAMLAAVKTMSQAFVSGKTIESALENVSQLASFDMLGEGARSCEIADRHYQDYMHALKQVIASKSGDDPRTSSGISIKLTAIHPRVEVFKWNQLRQQLMTKLVKLAEVAAAGNVHLTLDAEEADRAELTLMLFERMARHANIAGWSGLGLAVQAYSKRTFATIDWLAELAKETGSQFMVRLVKGAYWDAEIKHAQERGLPRFPVYTRKANTDLSYMACAQKLLEHAEWLFPQFATHNAHSLVTVRSLSEGQSFERQRIYGMGALLHDEAERQFSDLPSCRVYAPAGTDKDLLAYLTRRLIENGANSSFVNSMMDIDIHPDRLIGDPYDQVLEAEPKHHTGISLPQHLYQPDRTNSPGIDFGDMQSRNEYFDTARIWSDHVWTFNDNGEQVRNPAQLDEIVGRRSETTTEAQLEAMFQSARAAHNSWASTEAETRARLLESLADKLLANRAELMALLQREAGKTVEDALSEVREGEDFLRYYAAEARKLFVPIDFPSPAGETNRLTLRGRGIMGCISPWNFPLAIFLGQISASLATGNCVIAKPAPQTGLIAQRLVQLAHQAGVPTDVLHLAIGGDDTGKAIVFHPDLAGVTFTGSTEAAKAIARSLADRPGPILPLIAETGGINAMIVDSSALVEELVDDSVTSAFLSAGQRCSAMRLICVQQDIHDEVVDMLKGAMDALTLGDPRNLEADVGPLIDQDAHGRLSAYLNSKEVLHTAPSASGGHFFAPALVRVTRVAEVNTEQFGPILHVLPYPREKLEETVQEVNELGFGLTFGVHSRINKTITQMSRTIQAGNIYVNRSMTGAVVGTQPFGGQAQSGTGPKAGGPFYLQRFVLERVVTRDETATGGNLELYRLPV